MSNELNIFVVECLDEITDIIDKYNALEPLNKARAYLTHYALIRTCGCIEFVYRAIIADYFERSTLRQVHYYISKNIREGFQSAKYENICKLLGQFDVEWKQNFKQIVTNHPESQRIISSITSLVNNRHSFAHGRPSVASLGDIKQYFDDALILVRLLDSIIR